MKVRIGSASTGRAGQQFGAGTNHSRLTGNISDNFEFGTLILEKYQASFIIFIIFIFNQNKFLG